MAEAETKSEIARLVQHISLQYEAAKRARGGLVCSTRRHDFIIARMQQAAERVLRLACEGKRQLANPSSDAHS
ncbi:MAG: hypothetical protein JO202_03220 [Ktedonobacteraceae bacterium]|nr:hypothetical protein [Ktedonobacteraceae bacterium]